MTTRAPRPPLTMEFAGRTFEIDHLGRVRAGRAGGTAFVVCGITTLGSDFRTLYAMDRRELDPRYPVEAAVLEAARNALATVRDWFEPQEKG